MLISSKDFHTHRQNFQFTNAFNLLRIISGAFFIPHALSKFSFANSITFFPPTLEFFSLVGFSPAELWLSLAALGELVIGVCLILGIATHLSALVGAVILLIALISLGIVQNKLMWFWNIGGVEYLVFWILTLLIVSLSAFQKRHA